MFIGTTLCILNLQQVTRESTITTNISRKFSCPHSCFRAESQFIVNVCSSRILCPLKMSTYILGLILCIQSRVKIIKILWPSPDNLEALFLNQPKKKQLMCTYYQNFGIKTHNHNLFNVVCISHHIYIRFSYLCRKMKNKQRKEK